MLLSCLRRWPFWDWKPVPDVPARRICGGTSFPVLTKVPSRPRRCGSCGRRFVRHDDNRLWVARPSRRYLGPSLGGRSFLQCLPRRQEWSWLRRRGHEQGQGVLRKAAGGLHFDSPRLAPRLPSPWPCHPGPGGGLHLAWSEGDGAVTVHGEFHVVGPVPPAGARPLPRQRVTDQAPADGIGVNVPYGRPQGIRRDDVSVISASVLPEMTPHLASRLTSRQLFEPLRIVTAQVARCAP